MKKLIYTLLFLLVAFGGQAQDAPVAPKTTEKPVKDMLMLHFTHDRWLNTPDGVSTAWYSRGFKAEFYYDIAIKESPFSFALGTGISSHNVFSNGLAVTTPDTAYIAPLPEDYNYSINKMVNTYGDLAAELRFRTTPNEKNRSFNIAVGARMGMLFQTHSKTVDDAGKFKYYNFHNITETRYMAHARVGYGRYGVSAFYSLSPLFQAKSASDVIPFSVGFTITLF